MRTTGRVHGRDKSRLPVVFAVLSERYPDYGVTGEYLEGGWQVRLASPDDRGGRLPPGLGAAIAEAEDR